MTNTPENAADIEQAYRTFACHLIATIFDDLKTWAIAYSRLKPNQQEQLHGEFNETDLWEIHHFFLGKPTSGLQDLIAGLELQLDDKRVIEPVRPFLIKALHEANQYRKSQGLDPFKL